MSNGLLVALPWLTALLLHVGVSVPVRANARVAADGFRDARRERRHLETRLASLERRESARQRAALAFSSSGSEGTVGAVRRAVVTALDGAPVSGVKLGVRPMRAPRGAGVRLVVEGPFAEVLRLAGQLARAGSGLILEQVRLSRRPGRVALELQAFVLEGGP